MTITNNFVYVNNVGSGSGAITSEAAYQNCNAVVPRGNLGNPGASMMVVDRGIAGQFQQVLAQAQTQWQNQMPYGYAPRNVNVENNFYYVNNPQ